MDAGKRDRAATTADANSCRMIRIADRPFSYIVFRSRAHRDQVNKRVMADSSMNDFAKAMPFDMKRMAYGGFTSVVAF